MDLRTLPSSLSPSDRVNERRKRIETELNLDLSNVRTSPERAGHADEKNCEQMFGTVPIPVGYAGPLRVFFSSKEEKQIHLPLATTEGALVASVNRGCKAVSITGASTSSIHHGISRSIAWKVGKAVNEFCDSLKTRESEWKKIAEETSDHLKIISHEIESAEGHVFLTLYADTDEAMGMNMITIAAQAVGEWGESVMVSLSNHAEFVTVAGNVDSDKKPSLRTYEHGRGYEVTAETLLSKETIEEILKSSPEAMLKVAKAKLEVGSELAGAIGRNLHTANIIAALYLATGQDAAHVVEGSLSDTYVEETDDGLKVTVRLPAVIVGVRGGGTSLPAQSQCLQMLLKDKTKLHAKAQLAESIGAAVLAGEISLLAAQAGHQLARAHKELGR
jgi:hydroxymethylglutaryl-CoA reductase (NADPH)